MVLRNKKQEIEFLLTSFPVVGLVGPRQVGKTTLVKQLQTELKNTIYLDLESPIDYQKISNNPEWFFNNNSEFTIIIDEVQQMLSIFPILRSVIDRDRRNGRFILLGSASPEFLAKSAETLAGRIAYVELSPINVFEYSFQSNLWFRGGFPDALLATTDEIWQKWQANFIKTYIERDLAQLGISASPLKISQLLYMLAGAHSNLLVINNLSNSLKIDNRTLSNYLDTLEQAFIIRRLQPWYINISKRLIKTPKLYIRDSGNLHYLAHINTPIDLSRNLIAGHSWEGFVIQQIMSTLKENVSGCFYRTSNGAEVDLVLVKGIKPVISIEIKLSLNSGISRGNTQSIMDLGTKTNFIITPEGGDFSWNENWKVCNLSELKPYLESFDLV
ncbi:MAG: ATP-binding protein [Spirosomataceae bacterium]|jgi:predicted AAA+ superfamily ATPase